MKVLKVIVLAVFVIVVLAGVGVYFFVPPMVEKSMNVVEAHAPYAISPEAQSLHDQLVITDWHADSLLWNRNLLKRSDYGHVDIPRLVEGNVAIQMFTVVTKSPKGQNYASNTGESDNITTLAMVQAWPLAAWSSLMERALYQADRLNTYAEKAPGRIAVIHNQQELKQALAKRQADKAAGRTPLTLGLIGLEGAHALEGDLRNVQRLFDAGYRMIGPHHFFDNELGGSLHGTSGAGLTEFGRKVIREIDRLGIIIDLAHTSPQMVHDMMEMSKRPMVISHTGIHGHCKTDRNFKDDLMVKITARGGLIAIGYWDAAVCDYSPAGIVAAIDYAVKLVGEDHVALGSDFDGTITSKFDASELAALTEEMIKAEFSETVIRKVMGENSVRFLMENLPM